MRRNSSEFADLLVRQAKRENQIADLAGTGLERTVVTCRADGCDRSFFGVSNLRDHADAVHTFDDIRQMVAEKGRETYGRDGDYKATPVVPSIWVWVQDIAEDWVVLSVEEASECKLLQMDYSILNSVVTLGEPQEVVRRTVYDAVPSVNANTTTPAS